MFQRSTAAFERAVALDPNLVSAAGQLINANTTATTAFVMASGQPLQFYAVDKTHWRVKAPNSFLATGLRSR